MAKIMFRKVTMVMKDYKYCNQEIILVPSEQSWETIFKVNNQLRQDYVAANNQLWQNYVQESKYGNERLQILQLGNNIGSYPTILGNNI